MMSPSIRAVMPAAALALLLLAAPAGAHTFGADGAGLAAGLAHPVLGADHLLAMLGVGLWAALIGGRAAWLLPLLFPAAMVAGAALALAGAALPGVEAGVALSVLLVGLGVALAWQPGLGAASVLVAAFALLHGHAHGAELPEAASPVLYGLGFVAATLALHGLGLGLGVAARRLGRGPDGGRLARAGGSAIAAAGLLMLVGG